tara:strand:- start:4472 stop:6577 length:2106 start_codon:yes stop_codon:yes gene_type:complete
MADFSSQMENAYRKHFSASSQIDSRNKTGKYLYIAAWIVEIVAVLTGLLIALSNPYLAYNELTEPELIDKVLAFQGVLPLFAIAVVEATKIPLAQGFYMSRMLRWKILFMSALLLLIFVTFETMINGLETNFSFTTNRIIEEETTISEKSLAVDDLNNQIIELDKEKVELKDLSERSISETFQKSINDDNDAREGELEPLRNDKQSILDDFDRRIDNLQNDIARLLDVGSSDATVQDNRRRLEALEQEKRSIVETISLRFDGELKDLRERLKDKEKELREEQKEDAFLNSTEKEQKTAEATIVEIKSRISQITATKENEIQSKNLEIDREINSLTKQINSRTKSLGASSQSKINASEKKIAKLQEQRDRKIRIIDEKINQINLKYNSSTEQTSTLKNKELLTISQRKERIPLIEKEKLKLLEEIEENNEIIREAKKAKREKIQENNVFRLTAMLMPRKCKNPVSKENEKGKIVEECPEGIYLERDIANVTKEDTKYIAIIWFGSISFIIAVIGVMLAFASFVIRDEENFKAQKPKFLFNSFRRLITSFSLLLRKFGTLFIIIGKAITNFFDGLTHIFDRRIRDGIRRAIIGVRKKAREPKIKTVEVTKEVVVEKEIEVPVEKEKIVFKEVPKEVIRREMIHVPLYSTEHGKVDLDSIKMGEAATDNFTKAQSESIKTTKDASVKNQGKGKKSSENKSTKKK